MIKSGMKAFEKFGDDSSISSQMRTLVPRSNGAKTIQTVQPNPRGAHEITGRLMMSKIVTKKRTISKARSGEAIWRQVRSSFRESESKRRIRNKTQQRLSRTNIAARMRANFIVRRTWSCEVKITIFAERKKRKGRAKRVSTGRP